jgi:SAM-dependent methyltransferase
MAETIETITVAHVLEIGPGKKPQAHLIFPKAHITTLDIDTTVPADIHADARHLPDSLHGQFDVVFASHVLEHFPAHETLEVLKEWVKALRPMGQLHVIVPSLEWAAEEILSEQPSPALIGHLYSDSTTPWNVHRTGFTLPMLRHYVRAAGLSVIMAGSGLYPIQHAGQVYRAEQHYVIGVKIGGSNGTQETSRQVDAKSSQDHGQRRANRKGQTRRV